MINVIQTMLNDYKIKNFDDGVNAVREIIQQIILTGLSRCGFFDVAILCGETASRIYYKLDRFSRDLNFILLGPNEYFMAGKYLDFMARELNAYGLDVEFITKDDNQRYVLKFIPKLYLGINLDIFNEIRLKFEIDTESQNFGVYEFEFKELPSPHKIRLFDRESLFNDIICDILNQKSNYKVSGRILYDFAYYAEKNTKINLFSINEKLIEMEVISEDESLKLQDLKELLIKKFERINYMNAKKDVVSLIDDEAKLDVWGEEYFTELTEKLKED